MSICFIVGHGKSKNGGYDSGAVCKDYHEFRIAKEIARYAQIYYNSTYTERCELMNYEGDKYLTERISAVNNAGYDFVAEFHLNAGGGTGTECYHHIGGAEGEKYAAKISAAISETLGIKNRGAKTKTSSDGRDYFAIIRETKPTAVLIETAFIDTANVELINTPDGQKKCGEAIAKAVAKVRNAQLKAAAENEKIYRVQVGAFKNYDNALALLDKLKFIGFKDAFIKWE